MLRKLLMCLLIGAGSSVLVVAADEEKKDPPKSKVDRTKLFEQFDTDKDGKITKEEFKKGFEKLTEQVKDKLGEKGAGLIERLMGNVDKLFEKLDTDNDGKITKEEFEKFQPLGEGGFDREKLKELIQKFKDKGK